MLQKSQRFRTLILSLQMVWLIYVSSPFCYLQWEVEKLCFEYDTEPYYQALDFKVKVSINSSLLVQKG